MENKQIIQKIKNKINTKNIIYADIETIIIEETHYPYAIGFTYNNKYFDLMVETEEEILNYSIVETFINQFHTNEKKIIYFHNMSNFDGFLILHKILHQNYNVTLTERNNTIYNIKIDNNIFIRDSYLILPSSLKQIGHFFCEKHKKVDYDIASININNIVEKKHEILNYLKEDVLTLEEGMNTFQRLIHNKFDYDIHQSLSLSSIAFNIFRKNFYDMEQYPIYKNTRIHDNFIRDSYIGGITEVYKPSLKNGYCYDVNSLYPSNMVHDLPIGKPKFIDNFEKKNTDELFGFFKVIVCAPYMDRPVLPFKDGNKIISPYGKWCGTYFNEEIKNAKKYGYQFEYIKGYEYERGKVLKKYCTTLFEERKTYEKKHPMNMILKLLLNSLYGRFGMEIVKTNKTFIKKEEIKKYIENFEILEWEPVGENIYVEYIRKSTITKKGLTPKQKLEDYDVNTAVHIASAITAYSRIHMSQFLQDKNVCYTDTDSIYTEKKLKEELIGNELGMMKLENEIKNAIFIAPKNYNYIDNYNNQKIVFKGNNEKNVDICIINNKIYNNDQNYKWIRYTSFKKDYNSFQIKLGKSDITNNLDLNKREKIFSDGMEWIDTKPIKINAIDKQIDDIF